MHDATPIVSVRPIDIPAPDRGVGLQVRTTAPVTGAGLPVLIFAHGFGWSMDGYAPLVDYWAANGFVVVQPTFLDSRRLAIPMDDPRMPHNWRIRIADMRRCVDEIERCVAAVPGLVHRVDPDLIAVAGHSWGAQTASALLGARVLDADGRVGEDLSDRRVRAGVLLAIAGLGGEDLTPFASMNFPFMHPDFSGMGSAALVVAGDHDQSALSTRGPDWFTDAFTHSPGGKSLLTLHGAEHSLGGIAGYEVAETTDESPERRALLQRVTTAYLRHVLEVDGEEWRQIHAELAHLDHPHGRLESR